MAGESKFPPRSGTRQPEPIHTNHKATIGEGEIIIDSLPKPKRRSLSNMWLRDNCRCKTCVNQDTRQRNYNTFSTDILKTKAEIVTCDPKGLWVLWSHDNHRSFYPYEFLDHWQNQDSREPEEVPIKFFGYGADQNLRGLANYTDLMAEDPKQANAEMGKLTSQIRENGFAFIINVPHDDSAPTRDLLSRIGPIRETHYGGFYDFIPDLAKADTAYTNLPLPPHTDTTYFTEPAGLQAFHMLSHTGTRREPPTGGASLLVDGFHAADVLRRESPEDYDVLARVALPWHASGNEGVTIAPDKRYPALELDPTSGVLARVRWNNDDRGTVPFDGGVEPERWYAAATRWDEILGRREMRLWTQLRPGEVLIFDNWRVLHGRGKFTGVRRMCGAYINRDDYISRWRNTNFGQESILSRIIG